MRSPWRILPLLAAALLLGSPEARSAMRAPSVGAARFEVANGRLSGSARFAPLAQTLRELQAVVGGNLVGRVATEAEVVSFEFEKLPLTRALERILRHRSYVATIGSGPAGERLVRLALAGGRPAPVRGDVAVPEVSEADDPNVALAAESAGERIAAIEDLVARPEQDGDASVSGALSLAAERDPDPVVRRAALEGLRLRGTVDLSLLLGIARYDSDAGLRRTALEALRPRATEDPRIFEAVEQLSGDADEGVRGVAESLRAGLRAAGFRAP